MKLAILSRNANLYSTSRLTQAAQTRGHHVMVVDPLMCYMDITPTTPSVHFRNEVLSGIDAVLPRIGASVTFYASAVLRHFEMIGTYTVNESVAISRSRDKLRALQILSRNGIGMPVTGFAHSTKMTRELIELVGGAPLVIKLLEGTQGKGVVLAETNKAAESVIEAFREMDAYFLVQQFIKEARGCDIRAFVIGNKVVAAMQRKAKDGEFRSNLHRGGSAEKVELTPEETRTALQASDALGLNIAGVDILRAKSGPLVMEVNSSPGLEGIERTTGIDVAGAIIDYIEKNAGPNKTKTKGHG